MSRFGLLTNETELQDLFSLLTWQSREGFENAVTAMICVAQDIVEAYQAFEERLASNPGSSVKLNLDHADVFPEVKTAFSMAQTSMAGKDIIPVKTTPPLPVEDSKNIDKQ